MLKLDFGRPSPDFLIACERARMNVGIEKWGGLPTRECADAIYRELRALDAERLEQQVGLSAAFMDH